MFHAISVNFKTMAEVEDSLLKFAVIVCRYRGQWIFCRHRERSTWEVPGGHREAGETILKTAGRELYEETGALDFDLQPVCVYCVVRDPANDGEGSHGLLCYADVKTLGELPASEMEEVLLADDLPESMTYPLIQPHLHAAVKSWLGES